MKRIILGIAAILSIANIAAQTPQKSVNLEDMTFVRQSFVRNFYSSNKIMSQINMEGTDLFLPNSANLIIENRGSAALPSLKQTGRTLDITSAQEASAATIRVGAFHPYLCYEARFSDMDSADCAGIEFYPNNGKGEIIRTTYSNGKISSLKIADGKQTVLAEKTTPSDNTVELRLQYTGARFHVFRIYDDGRAELLYSVKNDMRSIESPMTHSFGIYTAPATAGKITLEKAQSMLSCGTGQADSQIIQTTDGKPLIKDGR
ncbi:MAG: hypothetical protein IIW60_03455, partial [Alistipes sp.]|nr:hypothetical protein [Alistipes sp.]